MCGSYCFWSAKAILFGGFLNEDFSKPQQLSTFALTLFQYKTRVDGNDVRVGKCNLPEFVVESKQLQCLSVILTET